MKSNGAFSSQEPWQGQLAYHEITRIRRDAAMFEWERLLTQYITLALAAGDLLHFCLTAGQFVYDVFGTGMQVREDANTPVAVYLDAARRSTLQPTELLTVGFVQNERMETFLIRIDFACQPCFNTNVYNRLRLEQLLRTIRQHSPFHYRRLLYLYQFRRNSQSVLPVRRHRIPPLEDMYSFLEGNPIR